MTQRALPGHAWAFLDSWRWQATDATRLVTSRFLLLPIGAAIAVVWANTASESYFRMAQRLSFAVNEVAMAFFFGLLAQEIVESIMPGGALHTLRRWSTPSSPPPAAWSALPRPMSRGCATTDAKKSGCKK